MPVTETETTESVRSRLLAAAMDCFLADEYHNVTTRQIAERAGANASMIHYYFGNKEGLYEEMFRETITPLLDALDKPSLGSVEGLEELLRLYYETMISRPEFPKLMLKVLALNQAPGKRFVLQLIERGRTRGASRVAEMKARGEIPPSIDPDVIRMSFLSLAMTPMLLKGIFEEQWGHPMDKEFLLELCRFNGQLFTAGLGPERKDDQL
jgi:AcrR family transcriptional regulator